MEILTIRVQGIVEEMTVTQRVVILWHPTMRVESYIFNVW